MLRIINLKVAVFVLLFSLLAVFLIHSFDSIGQDIGRHLKLGEVIWQTKSIPQTNLFSFTEPDFPFTNHHWLSEVIFYGTYGWFGFTGLILLKVFFVLAAFLLLFFIAWSRSDLKNPQGRTLEITFWPIAISFLLSIFIFIERTEVRPEIFSFAILAFFLFVLFGEKYRGSTLDLQKGRTSNLLWFLPLAELFWVNLHIYFFIGPFLVLSFLIDQAINRKNKRENMSLSQLYVEGSNRPNPKDSLPIIGIDVDGEESGARKSHILPFVDLSLKKIILILSLVSVATLANPNGLQGALAPFTILKEYGYSIVENQTLAFLADFFGFKLTTFVFKLSVAVAASLLVITFRKTRQRIFEILILAFSIYAGFKMLRNLPLYALISFPVLTVLLTDVFNQGSTFLKIPSVVKTLAGKQGRTLKDKSTTSDVRGYLSGIFKITIAAFLIFMIFWVSGGGYYKAIRSAKSFGFSVPGELEKAVNFVEENKIEGPMFNNFDIGGYLIWKLYPDHKLFVDNRPEAYSVKFFSEIYKPMQESKEKWKELSEKYGINFVFFGHTDATPWGQAFLKNIVRDSDWKAVFINNSAIILVKNIPKNKPIFSKYKYEFTEK
ncbi:MAG: hypothetical protein HYT63_02275 [Candidatus Yanofskybacteria bacterium]|nr:hypothetical protein [Candidatus Yanofskybacteria bacterium]